MKWYFRQRYKTYIQLLFGLLAGFILVTFLFDRPDYQSAILAISVGLIVGESLVFSTWLKKQKNI